MALHDNVDRGDLGDTKRSRGRAILSWLSLWLGLLGFVETILAFAEKIRTGHGGETYRTGHGYQFNYVGAIVLVALCPIVMMVGSVIG
jgi:hypothetical protein